MNHLVMHGKVSYLSTEWEALSKQRTAKALEQKFNDMLSQRSKIAPSED